MSKRVGVVLVLIMIGIAIVIGVLSLPKLAPVVGAAATPTQSLDPEAAMIAFAQCMRDNGVPSFPEPSGGELMIRGSDIDVTSPEFKAAESACDSLRPVPPNGASAEQDSEWERIVPGGDCMCADGSEYAFFERKADPTRVVFYLDGGGICFDAESCAKANTTEITTEQPGPDYDPNIDGENPAGEGGMLNFDRDENPFRDYSVIYVPLCTGDSHLGSVTREYTPTLTVEHKGFINGSTALNYLAEHYPDAEQIVVVGHTTASTPIYGGLASDLLPDARIVVFGTQSSAFPDDPDLNVEIIGQWGTFETMPDWEVNEGLTAREWGVRQFWIQAGLHDPDMIMARFDYAFDPNAAGGLEYLLGTTVNPAELLAIMDDNEAAIEEAGVNMNSYTAPRVGHGILEYEVFYEMEVNGVSLVEWLDALLAGQPLGDVRCDDCVVE